MKKYNAAFTDKAGNDWSLTINANSWKEANRDAKRYAREEKMNLWSVKMAK